MDLLCLEHQDYGQMVPQISDMNFLYPWIPGPSTDPMLVVDPFTTKCPAPKETEWEAKKPAIEHVYLTENQTLNATITCMREQHGFAATEKMYKRHFQLWGWHKYTTKGVKKEKQSRAREVISPLSPPEYHEPVRKKPRLQEEPPRSFQASSTTSTLIPIDLKQFQHFQQKAAIFGGINKLLDSHVRTATLSSKPCSTKYHLLQNNSAPRLRDGLYEALKTLDCNARLGWKAMERILDQIQHHIREDDITAFVELCFLIPRALLFSSNSRALRSYLSRLTRALERQNIQGPFAEVGGLLQDIYDPQRESDIMDLLVFASTAFAAALVEKYGREDRNYLLATWDSLRLTGQLDPTKASAWLGQWEQLHEECMSKFGRHSFLVHGLEDDLSGLVQPSKLYPQASCPAEIGGLINGVRRKLFLIPGEESESSSFEDDDFFHLLAHSR